MWSLTVVKDTLHALDTMEDACTDFEANVLETITRQCQQGRLPSVKQQRVLCEMVIRYLDDPALLKALQEEMPA